jgi:hypothetical protein
LFKGAKIVWLNNWNYYEKHHKNRQLELIYAHKKLDKTKLLTALRQPFEKNGRLMMNVIFHPVQSVNNAFNNNNNNINNNNDKSMSDTIDSESKYD